MQDHIKYIFLNSVFVTLITGLCNCGGNKVSAPIEATAPEVQISYSKQVQTNEGVSLEVKLENKSEIDVSYWFSPIRERIAGTATLKINDKEYYAASMTPSPVKIQAKSILVITLLYKNLTTEQTKGAGLQVQFLSEQIGENPRKDKTVIFDCVIRPATPSTR